MENLGKKPIPFSLKSSPHRKQCHFVGIGGVGMAGLAELMHHAGWTVTGSDNTPSSLTQYLSKMGIKIAIPHNAETLNNVDLLIYTNAISAQNNSEIQKAQNLKIPCKGRAEILGAIMQDKKSIAVAGTHGKTTITAILSHLSQQFSCGFSALVGGAFSEQSGTFIAGKPHEKGYIFEACEAFGSINHFRPQHALITKIEEDHMEFYKRKENLLETFKNFINNIPKDGKIVLYKEHDDPPIDKDAKAHIITYGLSPKSSFYLDDGYIVSQSGQRAKIEWSLPGIYNQLNAVASVAMGVSVLGIPFHESVKALKDFSLPLRRYQKIGCHNDIEIIDDYAHHPTEIKAVIDATQENKSPNSRVVVIFQPHLYSRTQRFYNEYANILSTADLCFLLPIYPSREKPITGVSSHNIVKLLPTACILASGISAQSIQEVIQKLKPGDIVLTLGAGSVTHFGPSLLKALKENHHQNF